MFFDLGCTKKKKTNLETDEAFEDEIEAAKDIFGQWDNIEIGEGPSIEHVADDVFDLGCTKKINLKLKDLFTWKNFWKSLDTVSPAGLFTTEVYIELLHI